MSKNNGDFFSKKKEWSIVKDDLLSCYLQPYFSKIFFTQKPVLYIDCFAGKGKFDDGKDGSPLIALKIIQDCIARSQITPPHIETICIEKKYAKELEQNLSGYRNCHVYHGLYEENIEKLLADKNNWNIFLYIDPFGIMSLKFDIFEKLQKTKFNSLELLINFSGFGFFRQACNVLQVKYAINDFDDDNDDLVDETLAAAEELSKIYGSDDWQNIVLQYKQNIIDGYLAEQYFTMKYCENLKKLFRYVLNMGLTVQKDKHAKYHLIHATNHIDGCLLMADNIGKRMESLQTVQNHGQISLFDENTVDLFKVEKNLRSIITSDTEQQLNFIISEYYMRFGVSFTKKILTDVLSEMEKQNKIYVKREPALTKTNKPSTFWTVDNEKLLFIRRRI